MFSHQRMKPGDAVQALRQPRPRQATTVLVLDLDVVVLLSPVVSDEQQPLQLLRVRPTESQHPETLRTNDQVLTLDAGTTSHQQSSHRRTGGRTICQ
jgi:hypothetical protein